MTDSTDEVDGFDPTIGDDDVLKRIDAEICLLEKRNAGLRFINVVGLSPEAIANIHHDNAFTQGQLYALLTLKVWIMEHQ